MAGGRRPGPLRGRTAQADALAQWLRELTGAFTLRELEERFPHNKSQWGDYRSGARLVPRWLLEQLLAVLVVDPSTRRIRLAEGLSLLAAAQEAERVGQRPQAAPTRAGDVPGAEVLARVSLRLDDARKGQLRAQSALEGSHRLVVLLLGMVGSLQERCAALESERDLAHAHARAVHQSRLDESVVRLDSAREMLARAQREREEAEALRLEAHRLAVRYEQELARLAQEHERRHPPAVPGPRAPLPQAPPTDAAVPALFEVDSVLEAAERELASNERELTSIREDLDMPGLAQTDAPDVLTGEVLVHGPTQVLTPDTGTHPAPAPQGDLSPETEQDLDPAPHPPQPGPDFVPGPGAGPQEGSPRAALLAAVAGLVDELRLGRARQVSTVVRAPTAAVPGLARQLSTSRARRLSAVVRPAPADNRSDPGTGEDVRRYLDDLQDLCRQAGYETFSDARTHAGDTTLLLRGPGGLPTEADLTQVLALCGLAQDEQRTWLRRHHRLWPADPTRTPDETPDEPEPEAPDPHRGTTTPAASPRSRPPAGRLPSVARRLEEIHSLHEGGAPDQARKLVVEDVVRRTPQDLPRLITALRDAGYQREAQAALLTALSHRPTGPDGYWLRALGTAMPDQAACTDRQLQLLTTRTLTYLTHTPYQLANLTTDDIAQSWPHHLVAALLATMRETRQGDPDRLLSKAAATRDPDYLTALITTLKEYALAADADRLLDHLGWLQRRRVTKRLRR